MLSLNNYNNYNILKLNMRQRRKHACYFMVFPEEVEIDKSLKGSVLHSNDYYECEGYIDMLNAEALRQKNIINQYIKRC